MTGEQMIYAMEHCKDDCKNCVASIHGKSCKAFLKAYKEETKKRREKFGELLRTTK